MPLNGKGEIPLAEDSFVDRDGTSTLPRPLLNQCNGGSGCHRAEDDTAANSFRLTAAEMFEAQQNQQLRVAGVLIKSYRDYTSPGNPSMTQTQVALAANTKQSVVSNLERGKLVPSDVILKDILRVVRLPVTRPEGKAIYENLRTIRDTRKAVKGLAKHKP